MRFWNRKATLQINDDQYHLDNLNFNFDVPFEDSEELMTSVIEVYNLSETKRNSIKKGHQIIINAGYENNVGLIFIGETASFQHKQESLDWKTTIIATDSMDKWLSSKINKSYKESIDANGIVKDLTNQLGIEVGNINLAINKEYPRGRTCVGKLKDILIQIVVDECKSRFLTRHSQLYITNPNDPIDTGYLLSPQTGLLKVHENKEQTDIETGTTTNKSQETKQEESNSKKLTSLLNHNLLVADNIQVESKYLNGEFKIVKGNHKGSYNGEYITNIEVKEVG